ncbi:NADAR family protein [Streptomyces sp. NPDC020362]|uniref:NADAR family protein n=1 Tax=unclassified Streptomyces TaxID=2593676 RepID=UPI0033FB6C0D
MDGQRIDGVWCHVWRRNLRHAYDVDDLFVYADGAILCERLTDLAGLEGWLASGLVTVTDPAAPPPEEQPRTWHSRSGGALTPANFLLEVADRIEELSGRPTAAQRCHEAVERFRKEPGEATRALLRDAYLAIPAHLRIFVLGDMDLQDRPLRMLLTDLGERVDGDGPVATAEMHAWALEYFRKQDEGAADAQEKRAAPHADDPAGAARPPVVLCEVVYPQGPPAEPGLFVLRNDHPAPVRFAGDVHPTVLHGYWALSAADEADRDRIRNAPTAREARELAGPAERRADWPDVRLAVMAGLLRAKFAQHPGLAEVLLATGDATISYTGSSDSPYWTDGWDERGRNWVGRLLELVRSELRAGVSSPTAE